MALIDVQQAESKPEPLSLRRLDEKKQQDLLAILPMLDRATLLLPQGSQLMMQARMLTPSDIAEGGHWLIGPKTQPALRFLKWNKAPVIIHPERITDIAALLVEADQVLSALERKFGTSIEPDQIGEYPPEEALLIALDFHEGETPSAEPLHRIWVGFPQGFAVPADPEISNFNMTQAPVKVSLEAAAASIDVDAASSIGQGDLLILRGGNWATALETPFGTVQGHLNPYINQFSIANGETMQGQAMTSDENAGEGGGFGALRVPVSVRLPDQSLTIEELGRLRAGLAVPVGQVTAGVAVELLVAGRVIAKGELVRLGEQFAVHIDTVPQDEIPPAPPTSDTIELPDETGDGANKNGVNQENMGL